jgi:hypothetical protein
MEQQLSREQIEAITRYYSNENVLRQIAAASQDREGVGTYPSGRYDSRPNIIQYPADVVQLVRKGVSSFHVSVERWSMPMALTNENHDVLRTGWDFLIDIDSKLGWEDSRVAAELICDMLERYGIRSYGIKFSGRRGFHIIVPWEAFPNVVDNKFLKADYPRVPRILAAFIRDKIKDSLMDRLAQQHTLKELLSTLESPPSRLDPYLFVEVEKDWGARHLFRAPYSFNEKTWLVAVPLERSQLNSFTLEDAKPENAAKSAVRFIKPARPNEAEALLLEALDWNAVHGEQAQKRPLQERKEFRYEKKIPEEYFPPCIKLALAGLKDGKKRSIFTLINFLRVCNWEWEEIEKRLFEWNEKNTPKLPRSTILGQLRWVQHQNRKINPANCAHDQFYVSIGLCQPDKICTKGTDKIAIKNPVVYPLRAMPREVRKPAQPVEKYEKRWRGFSCGVCNREFKTPRALAYHQGRVH